MLIFDETISGFRLALGGAAARYGVTPDLAVYGKAMAAGYPCSALVGSRDLFAGVAAGRVTHAGTFNGNVIATAAVVASLDELEVDGVYPQVEAVGTALLKGLRDLAKSHDLALHFQGFPMAFHASFNASGAILTSYDDLLKVDATRYAALANVLIEHGVWVSFRGIWYVSTAHTQSDVVETLGPRRQGAGRLWWPGMSTLVRGGGTRDRTDRHRGSAHLWCGATAGAVGSQAEARAGARGAFVMTGPDDFAGGAGSQSNTRFSCTWRQACSQ